MFTDGDTLYQRMLEDIRAAKHSIWFESFIWKSDQAGEDFKRELTAAAKRGVQVLAIYDKFANLVVPPAFKRFDPDIHVLAFPLLQPGNPPLSLRTWARDHRKILVVDEEVGYVGGYNIGQRYADTWRDTHLRVEGPGVWELSNAFTDFWNKHRKRRHPILPDRGAKSWEPRMRAIQNEPDIMLFPVRGTYIDAIERATESIRISQAYFLPDHTVVSALLRAAERGVAVHVLIPEYSNHILADWAARAGIHRLLAGGRTHPPVPARDDPRQDDDRGRPVVDDRDHQHRPPLPHRELRGQHGALRRAVGRTHDQGLRHRPHQLPGTDPRGMGDPALVQARGGNDPATAGPPLL